MGQTSFIIRLIFILAIVGVLFFFSIWYFSGSDKETASKTMDKTQTITILAFGDSLTAGYGLSSDKALPFLLESMLRKQGHEVTLINSGVSGNTSGDGLARLDWALQEPVDAAIVALGANDMLRGISPDVLRRNLGAILSRFRQEEIPVLLLGMRGLGNFGSIYANRYNRVFSELASEYEVLFYPFMLEGVALKASLNQSDGIHPNAKGTQIIADNIYPLVLELIELGHTGQR